MNEDFEPKEHELFGKDGFHAIVDRVAVIEKPLGIHDLAQFTPKEQPCWMPQDTRSRPVSDSRKGE